MSCTGCELVPGGAHQAGSLPAVVLSLLARWSAVVRELEAALHRVFYPDAVEEWLEENVQPSLRRLQALLQDLREAASARPHVAQDP